MIPYEFCFYSLPETYSIRDVNIAKTVQPLTKKKTANDV